MQRRSHSNPFRLLLFLCTAGASIAAPANRVTGPVDARRVHALPGRLNHLALPQFDQGAVDPAMPMSRILLMTKPSAAQQAELNQLLVDQQNPSSPQFHKWLTPDEFGTRFGLSSSDQSKIEAWLEAEGFSIQERSRGRNWIAFSGTAGQVSKSLHTPVHRFQVQGEKHYSNTVQPSVPEALAGVVGGFLGLNDFVPKPGARVTPDYNVGTSHYLVPQDFATIYNVAPLYQAGIDGTGVSIAVVGSSDFLQSDLTAFQKRYGLPAVTPKQVVAGTDPGFTGAQIEVNLDLEWASAIAPKATIYFVLSQSPFDAIIEAVNLNTAPIITSSYGICEIDLDPFILQATAQQGNAQGITLLNAIGDTGAAACDAGVGNSYATQGISVQTPGAIPEITAVGGTRFLEGTGTYWAATNSTTFGSALSYIPEVVWNESDATGLSATGGGNSIYYPRPAWQTGPGVPNDNVRHVPDVAFSAASHDGYYIYFADAGGNFPVFGTSAGTPAMAGMVALLNQYLVTNGVLTKPGLGNINPQLYRLAQSTPAVFHDTTSGDNIVPCAQGSPDCLTGSYGFPAGAGYDMTTGLGSIDANALATNWAAAINGVNVTLTSSATRVTANDTITLTATVAPASGSGTATGSVVFSIGTVEVALGSVPLDATGTATITIPAYLVTGTGTVLFFAQYSGDAAFSTGGASTKIQITAPTGVASIIPLAPTSVNANPPDAQGLSWVTTLSLREIAGVAAMLTGFTIDGQSQTLANYFPQTNILPRGTITSTFTLRNQATPVTHTYGFTGIDATGQNWSRQLSVLYVGAQTSFNIGFTSTPLIVTQNTGADPSCQWPVPLHLDDVGGEFTPIDFLLAGSVDVSTQIVPTFGTARLDAYGSIAGTLCFGGITPPATETITYGFEGVPFGTVTVTFAGPPVNPIQLSASPASIPLASAPGQPAQAALAVGLSDPAQQWTASIFPANRTSSWLKLSQFSGNGPANVTLTADGTGFEPGAYRATIVLQSANAIPQTVSVPVMMVYGGSTTGTVITGVVNTAANGLTPGAPGMLLTVTGTQLANATASAPKGNPLPFTTGGVAAYVNGLAAPLVSVSPSLLVLQIPYEAGAGPAVLGINNNGQVAGFQFQIAPAAPSIYDDGNGNLSPVATAKRGANVTVLVNGAGDVPFSPTFGTFLFTAFLPTTTYRPFLPVSVTVGGVPAFLQTTALSGTTLGQTQVSFTVPSTVSPGVQPVVVTVGAVASQAVNLTVQ
jgi:uncharacterized protein (TIGR03437 family)